MKKRTLVCFGLLGLLVVLGPAAQVVPVAVSPGRARRSGGRDRTLPDVQLDFCGLGSRVPGGGLRGTGSRSCFL